MKYMQLPEDQRAFLLRLISDNNGTKTRTIITVAKTTDFLTSIEELKTT